ncbi:hypothetical protein ACLFLC_20025 [Providencia rettgeri]
MENETLHTATSNQIPLDNAISSLRTYPKRNFISVNDGAGKIQNRLVVFDFLFPVYKALLQILCN